MRNHTVALKGASVNLIYGISGCFPIPTTSGVNVVSKTKQKRDKSLKLIIRLASFTNYLNMYLCADFIDGLH